jgi:hypothetical protein
MREGITSSTSGKKNSYCNYLPCQCHDSFYLYIQCVTQNGCLIFYKNAYLQKLQWNLFLSFHHKSRSNQWNYTKYCLVQLLLLLKDELFRNKKGGFAAPKITPRQKAFIISAQAAAIRVILLCSFYCHNYMGDNKS